MSIYHGSPDITVSQQLLNCADIVISLQEMGGKAVAVMRQLFYSQRFLKKQKKGYCCALLIQNMAAASRNK